MKLILEQSTKSYLCVEDGCELLTVVTNKTPNYAGSHLLHIVKGREFPETTFTRPPQGAGVLYDYRKNVIHTNVSEGYYCIFFQLKNFYFHYTGQNIIVYDSDWEISAELWKSRLELIKAAFAEKSERESRLLAKQWAWQKVFERFLMALCVFLSIGAVVYPALRNQGRFGLEPRENYVNPREAPSQLSIFN